MRQAAIQNPSVGSTIETIRKILGLSQEALARLLGVSVRTIVRWEKEGDQPPPLEWELIDLLRELVETAIDIMDERDVENLFAKPKEFLSGRRPLDLLSSFRGILQIREVLEKVRCGIFYSLSKSVRSKRF